MIKLLFAVFGFLVAVGIGAALMGKLLAAASARCRPLDDEQLNEGGWRSW